ncbi:MAG: sulfurtransferase TusA family protein [Firmicutes bacterium]|nr:sulfurtransferase TusA family protein [Bacillota bacterium]
MNSRPFDLDVRGLSCPEPVLRVKKILDIGLDKQLSIITDSRVSMENISRLARHAGFAFASEEQNGQFYLLLSKEV